MSSENDQERTEQATPKKRSDARKKGQVAQSREIPSALILLSSLGVFFFAGAWMLQRLSGVMIKSLSGMGSFSLGDATIHPFMVSVFRDILMILSPLLGVVLAAGVAGNICQIGFLFTVEPLVPKFSKMNPLTGMKRIVSLRGLMELLKSLVKIIVIGLPAYLLIKGELSGLQALVYGSAGEIMVFTGRAALKIGFYSCLPLIVLAVLDYAFQRWQNEKSLKMTKQEIKEETRQQEGDPQVKARIKTAQLETVKRRMMEKIPLADVVITNPTHFAVALSFESESMAAPTVVAKGAGFIAQRIKAIAREHEVPVVEQKPLARMLYKTVEIGDYIPVDLYRAVAEVLAYVYRLKGKTGASR